MCGYKFYLCLFVIHAELLKTVMYVGLEKVKDFQVFVLIMLRVVVFNQGVFILTLWTFFTFLALLFFFVYIIGKYARDWTLNEEVKYERAREHLMSRAEKIKKSLQEKNDLTLENINSMTSEADRISRWVQFWDNKRSKQNITEGVIKLLID